MRCIPLLLLVVAVLARGEEPSPVKPQTSQESQAAAIEAIKKLGGSVILDNAGKVTFVILAGPNVTDANLVHLNLKGLTNLRSLTLDQTRVTATGVKNLKAALPKCRISPPSFPATPKPKGRPIRAQDNRETGQELVARGVLRSPRRKGAWSFSEPISLSIRTA